MKESLEQKNLMEEKASNDANRQEPSLFSYRFHDSNGRVYYMHNTCFERIQAHISLLDKEKRRREKKKKIEESFYHCTF